jgi:hypothetical protein
MKKKDTLLVTRVDNYFRLESKNNGEVTNVRDHLTLVSENVYTDLIHRLNYRGFNAKWIDKSHTRIKVGNYTGFSLII